MPKPVNFSRSKKFSSDDDGMDYVESNPEYDAGADDPLRKQQQDRWMGADIDEKLAGGTVNRTGSLAGGPVQSNLAPYGRVAVEESIDPETGSKIRKINPTKMKEIAFEQEQLKSLGPQLADESAIEIALDAQIDRLEKATSFADAPEIMGAEVEIERLQGMLGEAQDVTKSVQEGMGVSYETEALEKRIAKASPGSDPIAVGLQAEDVKPDPKTPKGKGKGIKSSESIIQTGLEKKLLPTSKIKSKDSDFEYGKGGLKQVKVEEGLQKPGWLKTGRDIEGKAVSTEIPYGYDPMPRGKLHDLDPMDRQSVTTTSKNISGKGYTGLEPEGYSPMNPTTPRTGETMEDARRRVAKTARQAGGFKAGAKVSGTKVTSTTPDNPKQVAPRQSAAKADIIKEAKKVKAENPGVSDQRALRDATRRAKLAKIRGTGKGKSGFLIGAAAMAIGSALDKKEKDKNK